MCVPQPNHWRPQLSFHMGVKALKCNLIFTISYGPHFIAFVALLPEDDHLSHTDSSMNTRVPLIQPEDRSAKNTVALRRFVMQHLTIYQSAPASSRSARINSIVFNLMIPALPQIDHHRSNYMEIVLQRRRRRGRRPAGPTGAGRAPYPIRL